MAERRLHFTTQDDAGAECRGVILVTSAWNGDVEADPHAAFTIVLARQPAEAEIQPPADGGTVICLPARPVRLPTTVSEPRASYGAADTKQCLPLHIPRSAMGSFAEGALITACTLSIKPKDVFLNGGPRLDMLAQELIRAGRREARCWSEIDEALSRGEPKAGSKNASEIRSRLGALLEGLPTGAGKGATARLEQIAAGTSPLQLEAEPGALAEDVARLRCFRERPTDAEQLAAMRAYLDAADPAEADSGLADDYPYIREQLSFVALLDQPHLLDGMRAAFEAFRARYVQAYGAHHAAYWETSAALRRTLNETRPAAAALARLNRLPALGAPMGVAELETYGSLSSSTWQCDQQDLEAALQDDPLCPTCSIALSGQPPSEQVANVVRDVERDLGGQQVRLAGEAVRRILARGGERIERFLEIVQASDLTGLALVLDDELLAFISDLLAEPITTPAE